MQWPFQLLFRVFIQSGSSLLVHQRFRLSADIVDLLISQARAIRRDEITIVALEDS